ncbi:MAG: ATP-binding protein [Kofleriaceae bacterium]
MTDSRSRPLLTLAFGSVCVLMIIASLAGYVQWLRVRDSVAVIGSNALASIRLVQRMGLDTERERILIDRHIFEHEPERLAALETEIANVEVDLDTASVSYAPLATFRGEAAAWHQLTRDTAALAPRVAAALELSRKDADAEARLALAAAEPIYDAVDNDVTRMVTINQAGADHSLAAIEQLQRDVVELRSVLAGLALIFVIGLGIWVTRTIGRRERQIEHNALALENRNRELDAFAGRVAHDLRGPLNTIKLSGSLLAEQVPDEPRTALILQRGVVQMEQLIEDLLTLSRLDSEAVGQVAQTAAVVALVEDDLQRAARDVGGTLRIDVAPVAVRCSEGLLRQVLWNLGENAVKYRREEVPLELRIDGKASDAEYVLRVSDNGRGMIPNDAHSAFEPFFRAATTKAVPGTGLGLAIVRRIVEANGGRVSLDSVAGRGTTVEVHLRLATG